jgi:hypothetical protein
MAIIVTGGRPIFGIGVNGPYPPLDWPFGGFPTISTDIAIMSVFLFLFLIGFVLHLALFFVNLVRGRFIVQFLMTCKSYLSEQSVELVKEYPPLTATSLLSRRHDRADPPHCINS